MATYTFTPHGGAVIADAYVTVDGSRFDVDQALAAGSNGGTPGSSFKVVDNDNLVAALRGLRFGNGPLLDVNGTPDPDPVDPPPQYVVRTAPSLFEPGQAIVAGEVEGEWLPGSAESGVLTVNGEGPDGDGNVEVVAPAADATVATTGSVKLASPPRKPGGVLQAPTLTIELPSADRWREGRVITADMIGDTAVAVTGVGATGVFTRTAHTYRVGDLVTFVVTTGGSGLTEGLPYYVASVPSTTTFTVATTPGGSAITFATDLTAGTVSRRREGYAFEFTNMKYTTSAGRPAMQAADGGTGAFMSLLTKAQDFQNWEIRVRWRPANDTTTASTNGGLDLVGCFEDPANRIAAVQSHATGNPNITISRQVGGTSTSLSPNRPVVPSPLSTTQDRITRFRKEGDLMSWKEWASNTVEAHWHHQGRLGRGLATDNPERGQIGIRGQFHGAFILEVAIIELVRVGDNEIWNSDLSRIDLSANSGDIPKVVSAVGSTGVFTTTADHGYSVGDLVMFGAFPGGGGASQAADVGIEPSRSYFIAAIPTSATFTVARTRGGAAITFAQNITAPMAFVVRNPSPAWWGKTQYSGLLSGNRAEWQHVPGPDGRETPALYLEIVTPNDPDLNWTQLTYNVANSSKVGTGSQRIQPYARFNPARRMEVSYWSKGQIDTITPPSLGLTWDFYFYGAEVGALLMDRQTYHPGLSPTTLADSLDPASWGGNQQAGAWEWTFFRSVIEMKMWESVQQMRFSMLVHDSSLTGKVWCTPPRFRPIA